MMRIHTKLSLACASLLLALASPAQAVTFFPGQAVFDFTVGSNSNIVNGNERFFTAISAPGDPIRKVRVTAWSLHTVGSIQYVRDSKLMVYSGGLGVISDDDNGGSSNQHTIDNSKRKDFIILQFDQPLRLLSATFNTYSVLGTSTDSDATFKYGWSWTMPWNQSQPLRDAINDEPRSDLEALFVGTFTSTGPGTSNSRDINPEGKWGNIWLIGADFNSTSTTKIDGFKITNLAVIPEPATWATMIVGFGLMGASMRRRRRQLSAHFA
jgi:hypothetical protein